MSFSKPRIVVVGAGMAGISAATHLVENGLDNVLVLEAADRIGGRIHTVPFGDGPYPIELGANWIHGASLENSTFELAEKLGVLYPYRLNNRNSCLFMRENGTEIDRDTVKECIHAFQKMDDKLRSILPLEENKNNAIPISIKSLLDKLIDEEMATFMKRFPQNHEKIEDIKRVFNAMKIHLAFHEGDELHKVSYESDIGDMCGGDVHVPNGYIKLLQYLQNRLPEDCIQLQSEVFKITLSNETQTLEICLKNGTQYVADHVIVTCSVGYLKKHHAKMFSPPLPVAKVNAINSLGFGRVDKIFLEFDRPVTRPTYQSIGFAWDHTDIGSDKREWFRMLFGFDQVFTRDNTLLGWVVGDAAEYMESLSDREIGQTCVELLRKFLCDESIPFPKQILVSRWCSNPYVYGSYSYASPSFKKGGRNALAEPVLSSNGEPVILFAGEANIEAYFGCTHGARTSGICEAQRLVDLKQNRKLHSMM